MGNDGRTVQTFIPARNILLAFPVFLENGTCVIISCIIQFIIQTMHANVHPGKVLMVKLGQYKLVKMFEQSKAFVFTTEIFSSSSWFSWKIVLVLSLTVLLKGQEIISQLFLVFLENCKKS